MVRKYDGWYITESGTVRTMVNEDGSVLYNVKDVSSVCGIGGRMLPLLRVGRSRLPIEFVGEDMWLPKFGVLEYLNLIIRRRIKTRDNTSVLRFWCEARYNMD